ncbi:MAG: bifunctional enoyl-CoA hydratase/phosphate acetyltransferase [Rhodospirillales bacterium]
MTQSIENRTFAEIVVGETAHVTRVLRPQDVETWAAVTGDPNLLATSGGGAVQGTGGAGDVGIWATSLISQVIGTRLPGLGSSTRSVTLDFAAPVPVGKPVTATVRVAEKDASSGAVKLDCHCTLDDGSEILAATALVVAPRERIRAPLHALPKVQLQREDRYLELLARCERLAPMRTAVVYPCSPDALAGVAEAAEQHLIAPILVGPEAKIRAVADAAGVEIPYRIVAAEHSEHAAALAVELVRRGEADNLMKGSLHTDELLRAVLRPEAGLRTGSRLSHCFLLAVPTYPRPIILTDAAINISPDLRTKRDICQNAIDLARALGLATPKLAILAAVETVNPDMPATLEAASLCKMADRGQITGGILDGPLAFDNAVDEDAARTKGIVSPVAGRADILVAPDLEAGNMLAKQLTFMAGAEAAGIIVGARVPVVLTSRADSARTRLASCALSVLMAEAQRTGLVMRQAAE